MKWLLLLTAIARAAIVPAAERKRSLQWRALKRAQLLRWPSDFCLAPLTVRFGWDFLLGGDSVFFG